MQRVYLDTCIISGLAKSDLQQKELNALLELLNLHKKEQIQLVTSEVTKLELDKIPPQVRKGHEIIYLLLKNVPASKYDNLFGIIGTGIIPFPSKDPLFTKLKDVLPDENDRKHVFQALKNNCAYFITTDRKTILKNNKKLFLEFNELMVMSPSEIMELLNTPL